MLQHTDDRRNEKGYGKTRKIRKIKQIKYKENDTNDYREEFSKDV